MLKSESGRRSRQKWLDARQDSGCEVNAGEQRRTKNSAATDTGKRRIPKSDDIAKYLDNCIESLKELADYGGKVGVKVTLENHWGLTANPTNIVIMIDDSEQSVVRGDTRFLQLGTRVPAVQRTEDPRTLLTQQRPREVLESLGRQERRAGVRCRIMMEAKYDGVFALEYEEVPGTALKALSISTRKCWPRSKHS